MEIIRLRAEPFLKLRTGYASSISDPKQLATLHCHDYYELFVVNSGTAIHQINGVQQRLEPGMLYFVRPDDVHAYITPSSQFQISNIIVPSEAFRQFLNYVGDSYYSHRLLAPILPPHTSLSRGEMEALMDTMRRLKMTSTILKSESDTLFRIAIFNLLTTYFPVLPQKNSVAIPDWLKIVHDEMLKKANFTEGLPAFYRLSGKSIEHTSRACRKYLNKTPSQLVNDIRLEYAARRLIESDDEIMDICSDTGIDSLSHFYHLFRDYFGTSPKKFRKQAEGLRLKEHLPASMALELPRIGEAVPLQSVLALEKPQATEK